MLMYRRKLMSFLLTFTLIMTLIPAQVFAQNTTEIALSNNPVNLSLTTPSGIALNPYVGCGFEAEFNVLNQWEGAFTGEIRLTNTGTESIENWILSFEFAHEITSIWNAEITMHENDEYIIKNLGWNQDIAAGETITIGFNGIWKDEISVPTMYEILGVKDRVEATAYNVDFNVLSNWQEAFTGEIVISNVGDASIEDWILEFDFDRNIQQFWEADIVEHKGMHYVIKNRGHNANIGARETLTLGFMADPGTGDIETRNYILSEIIEKIDYDKDTDGDGLTDEYEIFCLGTDPTLKDTNDNGIMDGDEDEDEDGLSNLLEYNLGTNPLKQDTDKDGLTDFEEAKVYMTNPLIVDTDEDGLNDGDDIYLGFNPLKPDTNDNGVLDSEEKVEQSLEEVIDEEEKPEIVKVSVGINTNGNIKKTTTINNMYKVDMLSSEVVGLIGVPVEINTTSRFDKATLTFTYDESKLGDTAEEDLAIMWYNKEENWYEILDNASVVDTVNNTVSVTTSHFSTYLVVDRQEWYAVWRSKLNYARNNTDGNYNMALVIDKSGSMSGTPIANAKYAARSFINEMYSDDNVCVVAFNDYANSVVDFTVVGYPAKKQQIKDKINNDIRASGGTSTNAGLKMALDSLIKHKGINKQAIILLCDGDVDEPSTMIARAKENNIKIYTINFGSSGTDRLSKIAKETGGEYFYAKTVEQMLKAFYETHTITVGDIDKTDTDHDGLYDTYEIVGMRLSNGRVVRSDPLKAHSDNDGLSDFEEMGGINSGKEKYIGKNEKNYVTYFNVKSDPRLDDSDGDLINDDKDPEPLFKCSTYIISKTGKIYHLDSRDVFFICNCKVFQQLTNAEKADVMIFLKNHNTISDEDLSKMGYDNLAHGWVGTLLDLNYSTSRLNLTSEEVAWEWNKRQQQQVLQCLEFLAQTITWKQVELVIKGEAYYGLNGKIPSKQISNPEINRKLDYLFGKATGNIHNIERSVEMQRQLNSIGIFDNDAGRKVLIDNLEETLNSPLTTVSLEASGKMVKQSLLVGPRGTLMMESVWDNTKLITVILYGGK